MRQGSTALSGARVFAAGSLYFATSLDEWPVHGTGVENSGLQHFAVNLLTDLGGVAPATLEQPFAARRCSRTRSDAGQDAPRPLPWSLLGLRGCAPKYSLRCFRSLFGTATGRGSSQHAVVEHRWRTCLQCVTTGAPPRPCALRTAPPPGPDCRPPAVSGVTRVKKPSQLACSHEGTPRGSRRA
jgi:hypothetical protein